ITEIIVEKSILTKGSILTFLELSGKYENDATEILEALYEMELDEKELESLDKLVSQQLKFSIIGNASNELADLLTNYQTENYEDFDKFIVQFADKVDSLSKN